MNKKITSMKKNALITIFVFSLLLSSCGKTLLLDKASVAKKTYGIKGSPSPEVDFKEETIGNFLLLASASFIAGPAFSAPIYSSNFAVSSEKDKIAIIKKYDPIQDILAGIEDKFKQDLEWKKDSNPDYLLSARTTHWGIRYHPIKVTKYAIVYSALVEVSENKEEDAKIALFHCNYKSNHKYSYDEVFAKKALIVKENTKLASKKCIKDISKKIEEKISQNQS